MLLVGGCYQEYQPATTPQPYFEPQPIVVQGPPGGQMDPEGADVYSNGAAGGVEGGVEVTVDATTEATATVNDAEIDSTLEGYGMWIEDEEYGRIWRPSATVVGADFTPYETCGTWVWTEGYGWTFSCDWNWGWLPFHYGYWGWFDDYWAWVPDYYYSPAWVEWRNGGGYTGWRPIGPSIRDHRDYSNPNRGPIVRDHRNPANRGPIIRDHRGNRTGDADWRFVADRDLGRRIRPTIVRNNAEGIRATSVVTRPPMGPSPHARAHVTQVSDLMKPRFTARNHVRGGSVGTVSTSRPTYTSPTYTAPARPYRPRPSTYTNPTRPSQSTGMSPLPTYQNPTQPTYTPPTYTPPSQPTYPSYGRPTRPSPSTITPDRPGYRPTRPTMQPSPARPYTPDRPTYSPSRPSMTPSTPSRPTFTPSAPSRPSYTPSRPSAPSRSYTPSAPSRSYTPSHSSSSPSRASSSSSSSSGRSYSGGGRRR
jgi:hypothetical protein